MYRHQGNLKTSEENTMSNMISISVPSTLNISSTCGEFTANVPMTEDLVMWAVPYALGVAGQRIASGAKPDDQRAARKALFESFELGHVPSKARTKKAKAFDPYEGRLSVLQFVLTNIASQLGHSLTRLGSRENPKSSKEQFERFLEVTGHDARSKAEQLEQLLRDEEAAREKRRLRASLF